MKNDILTTALHIAMDAHDGQVDRAGKPYIYHPLTVASMTDNFDAFVTALLHDVMEDSHYTTEDLQQAGIPDHIIAALRLLTHDKEEPYLDYVQSVKENDLARAVKLCDLKHNSDLSRLPEVTEQDRERAEKYRKAMDLLMQP